MKSSKFHPLSAVLLLAVSMLACNIGSNPPAIATDLPELDASQSAPQPTETAGACDNRYLPVVVGATWNYKISGPAPDTYTHTVLTLEGNGFTEQDVFDAGVTRQGKWTCESGDLIALDPSGGSSGTVNTENVQVDLETKDLSGITLPAMIDPNDTWSQSLTLEGTQTVNGTSYPARNQMTSDCKALGIESVTVEAGTFEAMRVECKTVMNLSLTIGGNETATTLTLTGTNWYVENVGMVKNLTTGLGFDSITELISYSIPN